MSQVFCFFSWLATHCNSILKMTSLSLPLLVPSQNDSPSPNYFPSVCHYQCCHKTTVLPRTTSPQFATTSAVTKRQSFLGLNLPWRSDSNEECQPYMVSNDIPAPYVTNFEGHHTSRETTLKSFYIEMHCLTTFITALWNAINQRHA